MAEIKIEDTLLGNVKELLDLQDTSMYDKKLALMISAATTKLQIEGVKEIEQDDIYYPYYCICVSYNVAMDLDLDVNLDSLYRRYLTSVNTLRSRVHE